MKKRASVNHPVHEIVASRWSPRAFADRELPLRDLESLIEAARWAPSAYNDQPWHFIVARREDGERFDAILDCLVEGNRTWAKRASALAIAVASLHFDHNQKRNRHAEYDTGQAVAWMTVQAGALGIFIHQMGGFNADKTRKMLGIPEGYEPMTAIALGYPGELAALPDALRESETAPRIRKSQSAFVHWGTWSHKRQPEPEAK